MQESARDNRHLRLKYVPMHISFHIAELHHVFWKRFALQAASALYFSLPADHSTRNEKAARNSLYNQALRNPLIKLRVETNSIGLLSSSTLEFSAVASAEICRLEVRTSCEPILVWMKSEPHHFSLGSNSIFILPTAFKRLIALASWKRGIERTKTHHSLFRIDTAMTCLGIGC